MDARLHTIKHELIAAEPLPRELKIELLTLGGSPRLERADAVW
jgi:hypothetical protein